MVINLSDRSRVNVTLNEFAKVSVDGDFGYEVYWYYNGEYLGHMEIGPGTWGSMVMPGIGDWRIDFKSTLGDLHGSYNYNTNEGNILVILNNENKSDEEFYKSAKNHVLSLSEDIGNELYVHFKGSELCDFEGTRVKPLRLNDKIDYFDMIYNIGL